MKVHVYTIARNEEYMLPYFLRHYETFADKIFVIDNCSTDNTVNIAQQSDKTTVFTLEDSDNKSYDDYFCECFTKHYKENSRGVADWVIRVDTDELVYHKDVKKILQEKKDEGVKILKTRGYFMITEELPTCDGQIYEEAKKGVRIKSYDKPAVFDPSIDLFYEDGRHAVRESSEGEPIDSDLKLLHYRYLSEDYFISRSTHLFDRRNMPEETREYRMNRGLKHYNKLLKTATNIID